PPAPSRPCPEEGEARDAGIPRGRQGLSGRGASLLSPECSGTAKEPFGYRIGEESVVAAPVSLVASRSMTLGKNVYGGGFLGIGEAMNAVRSADTGGSGRKKTAVF
ncbi:MAG: hypothetical protein J5812_02460, partial [Candidatus Methanomethylophilaceae archaeon]|nr:hypothetical protein [Candidatus Methanomethylophilaceae archaeon]